MTNIENDKNKEIDPKDKNASDRRDGMNSADPAVDLQTEVDSCKESKTSWLENNFSQFITRGSDGFGRDK